MDTSKPKRPTSNPPPKQMSILNFLSRGSTGPSQSQNQPSKPPPPAPKVSGPLPGIPPPLNRYTPAPSSLTSVSTPPAPPAPSTFTPDAIDSTLPIPPSVALTPTASLVPVSESHIPTLRTLNQLTLPVQYGDNFYSAVLSRSPSASGIYSRIILTHPAPSSSNPNPDPIVAGAVVCRTEVSPFQSTRSSSELALYIQSLALFSPYRGQGLMGLAVRELLRYAASNPPGPGCRIADAFAHVWTENEEGLRWYASQGFEKVGEKPLEGYYHRLRPGTAWVLRRRVRVGDMLSPQGTVNGIATSTKGTPLPITTTTGSGLAVAPPRGPPSGRPSPTPSPAPSGKSFQNARPDMEWNDLPADMVSKSNGAGNGSLSASSGGGPPPSDGSATGSAASSRSSSVARKKKTRDYPAAAFKS